jgi:2'-5' RNA ligase
MHGIVSILDEDHYRMVEDIWAGLDEALGLRGVYTTPYPHFSYHVAEHYDIGALELLLREFAAITAPFDVLTTGLGIFTEGINPVVYVSVARSPQLSAINASLWPLMADASAGIVDYYNPQHWVPHITLGHGDVTRENLAQVIQVLSRWDYTWRIPIDNVALLFNPGDARHDILQYRFPLTGVPAPA